MTTTLRRQLMPSHPAFPALPWPSFGRPGPFLLPSFTITLFPVTTTANTFLFPTRHAPEIPHRPARHQRQRHLAKVFCQPDGGEGAVAQRPEETELGFFGLVSEVRAAGTVLTIRAY